MLFNIAKFEEDDSRQIRFLTDIEDAIKVYFHYDYKNKVDVVCYNRHLDGHCNYCGPKDTTKLRERWGFYVYDIDNKQVQIIITMASEFSLLPRILEQYDKLGSLAKKDFVVDKSGMAIKTEFYMIPVNQVATVDKTCQKCYDEFGTEENLILSVDNYFRSLRTKS